MWPADEKLRRSGLDLYDQVWPILSRGIRQARGWGSDWFEVSTPFLVEYEGQVVAHTGVVHCDWWIEGRARSVAALHAVCVHPEHRGQGLGRTVVESALAHIDALGTKTTVLWSEKEAFYAKFGFSARRESIFRAPAPEPRPVEALRLDLRSPDDLAILRRTLATRMPVSALAAAADNGGHFLIDLGLWREAQSMLVYLPDDEAIAAGELRDGDLVLYDLVAKRPVPVAVLAGAFASESSQPPAALELHFTPDRLDIAFEAHESTKDDSLMVRGEPLFAGATPSFAFSPFTYT